MAKSSRGRKKYQNMYCVYELIEKNVALAKVFLILHCTFKNIYVIIILYRLSIDVMNFLETADEQ